MVAEIRPFGELFVEGTRNGLTRPKAVRGAGVKMVNMGELFAHPRLRNADMDRVPLSDSEAQKFLLKEGDLLFARQSLVLEGAGKCSIFLSDDEPVTFESHVIRVRLDRSKADPCFYFYYLQSHHGKNAIRSIVEQGAGASGIRGSDLQHLGVLWMPPPEQRAIAHILGTLDDKIELNRRRNQTLEAMARALFKDWFVDFGPVRAKMAGQEPYLPADLWQLFPDRLDDEGKPEGWETKRVSDYLSLAYGKSLPAVKRHSGGVPVYGSGGITGFHSEALVNEPAVIVGRKGTVGSLFWEDRPCFPIDTVFFVQPKAPLPFCYYLLESLPLRDMNTDAAVPGLNRENVYRLEVAAPPTALITAFAATASRFRENIAAVSRQSETLAQLRDTLLPKLISGELRIKDAEMFIEAAQ
ncbi:MAG TPA: restriction endonuclease subunit S [Candidatus Hydrogenedentes bacterium]|nr:restriction endonuclease subunit S [Candidatus Hydrogenedentota bacterium]